MLGLLVLIVGVWSGLVSGILVTATASPRVRVDLRVDVAHVRTHREKSKDDAHAKVQELNSKLHRAAA
jgi:hypothetical protein